MSVEVRSFFPGPAKTKRGKLVVLDGSMTSLMLKFPINPDGFEDSHSANYADHAIIGRSHPRSQWTNSGNRELSFKLELDTRNDTLAYFSNVGVLQRGTRGRASPFTTNLGPPRNFPVITTVDGGPADTSNRLVAVCNFLRALTKPRQLSRDELTSSEIFAAPPPVLFVWGSYFRIRCIVRSVKIKWEQFTPELSPKKATVDVNMTEQPVVPVTYNTYVKRGDLRASTDETIYG